MSVLRAYGCLLTALSLTLAAGCNTANPGELGPAPPVRHDGDHVRVDATSAVGKALEIAPVQSRSVERPILTPGVVEADPARLVKVVPPVSGRIVHLGKHLGDEVQRGDVLFTLDSPELAQAIADAAKADAALALSRRALDRERELMDAQIAARKDLEQAESEYALADSEARRARVRLSQLDVRPDDPMSRQYSLRAPIDGRVIELTAAQGGFWNDMNAPIMTVADLSSVWVSASVAEKDLAAVVVGEDATIELNAFPGELVRGQVKYVGAVLDPDTRTVKARIAVDNASGRFRPGMFARVVFHSQAHQALVVPATALLQTGFDTQVYVARSPEEFEAHTVTVGTRLGDSVEVLSGLQGTERIVVKNGALLGD